ncbi:hypothetical protein MVEG_06789 [Podila verticillata NRRL 6337]|nr:hypothetical protein MVEG_06789 [Podila verticillata NRRL 6337]
MLRHSTRLQSQSIWRAASSPSCGHHQIRRVVLNVRNALELCESPSTRTHLHQQRHFSTNNPPSSSPRSSFIVRQRKNNTWLPQWQTLILSDTDSTNNSKKTEKAFRPTENQRKDGSDPLQDEVGIAKYLLSPQTTLAVFLPKGFPESVTPNYWPFAKWQFAHNVAGSVTAVISTQSLLFAMGLGAGSIPMAAALNWIIKDGLGQLGGVVYASFVSDKFDSEPKRFRFQATVAMQGANVLELLTPLWPGSFLVIASISNIGKNMAWLASSATRAQMNKTFALRDNLGDITGKSGSQTTAAGLVGTGLGVVIAALMSHVSEDPTVLPLIPMCLTFLPFSIFNIYSNYKSSHYVTTPSLNVPRTETVFHRVLEGLVLEKNVQGGGGETVKQTVAGLIEALERLVPVPMAVAHEEVFVTAYRSPFKVGIEIEPVIGRFAGRGEGAEILDRALRQTDFIREEKYYLMVDDSCSKPGHGHGKGKAHCHGKVVVWFDKQARGVDLIRGFYHACATRALLEKQGEDWRLAVAAAHAELIETAPRLIEVMNQKGWDTESLFLTDGDRNRIHVESIEQK